MTKLKQRINILTLFQRRRTQVRLAQQAYRRRKDATQVSLQDECRHLHELLSEIESTFEDFYTHAAKHNQLLGTNEPRLLLDRTARQLRLLWKSSNCIRPGAMDPYRTGKSYSHRRWHIRTYKIHKFIGSMLATPYGSLVDIDITKYDDQMHNISLNSPIRQSTQVLSDGNNVSSRSPHPRSSPHKQLQINDTVPQPQIPVFDPCNKPDIPFSARLRYEGLKRGYELLAEKHTPYSIICRVFRFCVFTSTRDQIVNHLETLLQSSGLSTFEVLRMRVPNGWSWDMDNEVEQLSPNNNGFKINSTETALPDKLRSWTEVTSKITPLPYDSIFNYMDAQAVQEYLVSKGLVMNSKASSMALPQNLMNLEGGMFEDFLGRGGILLDVQRLLEGTFSSSWIRMERDKLTLHGRAGGEGCVLAYWAWISKG